MATTTDNDAMTSNLHPLLIHVVVDNVFRYLRLKDIIKQRAVCKLWHDIGTKFLLSRIDEIKIAFGSGCSTDVIGDARKTVDRFLQMQRNCSFNFTNFSSVYWENNTDPDIPNTTQTTQLFNECGLHMKRVALYLSGKSESWKFLSDILVNKAPNLEELHLESDPVWNETIDKKLFPEKEKPELKLKSLMLLAQDEYGDPIYSRELLTDIFKSSPHLECLAVGLNCSTEYENNEVLILQTLRDNGNVSNLKELYLSVGDENIFRILATSFKSAPLKDFNIPIIDLNYTMLTDIDTFLYNHKSTYRNSKFFLDNLFFR